MADTRTQWAFSKLRHMIMENELQHGQPYLEQTLATRLGISRTPLREAALRLQEEGFVDIRPRLGIHIRPISCADMSEIYDILTELEPYAARRLAEMPAPAAALDALTAHVAAMEAALSADDLRGWAAADRAFHQALIEHAGNRRAERIVSTLFDQVHRARILTLNRRSGLDRSNDDHRRLIALIRAGDGAGAADVHRTHRETARREMLVLLSEMGVDGV